MYKFLYFLIFNFFFWLPATRRVHHVRQFPAQRVFSGSILQFANLNATVIKEKTEFIYDITQNSHHPYQEGFL